MTSHAPRVLVVTTTGALAAMLEAALGSRAQVRVAPDPARALGRLIEDHDPGVVVLEAAAAQVPAALATIAGLLQVPPVVLLVDDPHDAWTAAARRAGVRAVLSRESSPEEIRAAVDSAAAGLITLHPDVFRTAPSAASVAIDEARALTTREREILEMMAEGLSNRTIGRRLGISSYTVKFHVASILDKLGAKSRTEAVTLGMRRGLITL